MTEEQFWQVIGMSQKDSSDCESQAEELQTLLSNRSAQEIVEFDCIFRQKLIESYTWDLWGVAYLINGGCSDDGFEYFRCWLIGQGAEAYRKAIADPQSVIDILKGDEEELECEGLMYASSYAHEAVAQKEIPWTESAQVSEPNGEPWEEEDLESRFPRVAERYL
jgi:Protein of unknown function (DUF4240)